MIPGTKRFFGGLGYGEVPPDKRLDGRVSISHSNLGGPWVAGLSCRSSLVSSPHDPIIQEPGVHWVHFSYLFRWGTEGIHGGLIISLLGVSFSSSQTLLGPFKDYMRTGVGTPDLYVGVEGSASATQPRDFTEGIVHLSYRLKRLANVAREKSQI